MKVSRDKDIHAEGRLCSVACLAVFRRMYLVWRLLSNDWINWLLFRRCWSVAQAICVSLAGSRFRRTTSRRHTVRAKLGRTTSSLYSAWCSTTLNGCVSPSSGSPPQMSSKCTGYLRCTTDPRCIFQCVKVLFSWCHTRSAHDAISVIPAMPSQQNRFRTTLLGSGYLKHMI